MSYAWISFEKNRGLEQEFRSDSETIVEWINGSAHQSVKKEEVEKIQRLIHEWLARGADMKNKIGQCLLVVSRLLGLTLRPSAPVFSCHLDFVTHWRLALAQEALRDASDSY